MSKIGDTKLALPQGTVIVRFTCTSNDNVFDHVQLKATGSSNGRDRPSCRHNDEILVNSNSWSFDAPCNGWKESQSTGLSQHYQGSFLSPSTVVDISDMYSITSHGVEDTTRLDTDLTDFCSSASAPIQAPFEPHSPTLLAQAATPWTSTAAAAAADPFHDDWPHW